MLELLRRGVARVLAELCAYAEIASARCARWARSDRALTEIALDEVAGLEVGVLAPDDDADAEVVDSADAKRERVSDRAGWDCTYGAPMVRCGEKFGTLGSRMR